MLIHTALGGVVGVPCGTFLAVHPPCVVSRLLLLLLHEKEEQYQQPKHGCVWGDVHRYGLGRPA